MAVLRILSVCPIMASLLALSGCGGGGPQMAEVEGTIKLKGKPLDGILVEFWPEVNGPRSRGNTDAQGRFKLETDDGKRSGAVVGTHKIVLRDSLAIGPKFMGRAGDGADLRGVVKASRIAKQYGDPHKTDLRKEVTGGRNMIELDVVP